MSSKRPRKLKSSQRTGSRAARSIRASVAPKRTPKKRSTATKKAAPPKRTESTTRGEATATRTIRSKPPPRARSTRGIALPRMELLEQAAAAGITGRHRMTMPRLRAALARLADQPAASAMSSEASLSWPASTTPPLPIAGLPWRYGVTELVAMPVDPLQVHVYWELLPEVVTRVRADLGAQWDGARQVLRAYDVTTASAHNGRNGSSLGRARHQFDCEVGGEVGTYYLHLWSPEQTLVFEIGWLGRDGRFVPAARSNRVHAPRNAPAQGGAERWMTVRRGQIIASPHESTPIEHSEDRAIQRHPAPWSATFPAHRGWRGGS